MGLDARKPVCGGMRSLISTFVIRVLKSTISKLATSEISFFYLGSVAEQACLNPTLSETPKTGFVATKLIILNKQWEMALIILCT